MPLRDQVQIGARYCFDYPSRFVTLLEYTAHRGELVTVIRQATPAEAEQGEDSERMFLVRAADGWVGFAWASELVDQEGTLRELWDRQGVARAEQDRMLAEITAKAAPGAKVGPFTIGGGHET